MGDSVKFWANLQARIESSAGCFSFQSLTLCPRTVKEPLKKEAFLSKGKSALGMPDRSDDHLGERQAWTA